MRLKMVSIAVLSVRFEVHVGVSLLLAPAGADKRGPRPLSSSGKCSNTAGDSQESLFLPELWQELGLTESNAIGNPSGPPRK